MAYGTLQAPSAPSYPPQTAAETRRMAALVNTLGAVLSVALVSGVGLWSYRLMVRDVSGIPVIRALEGPMRVSPADPGGRQAAYQGLAVNSVAAQGGAGTPPAVIALAPATTDLQPEDRITTAAAPITPPDPELAPGVALAEAAPAIPAAVVQALAQANVDTSAVAPGTPGVARSPMPPRRPARSVMAVAAVTPAMASAGDRAAEAALQEVVTRMATPRSLDIDPASLTAGTRLVQFGAYATQGEARQAWDDLVGRFPAYLDGRGRVIEPATAGGRVFYRLRAHGFRDEPEARRFCSVFVGEDLECTPVLIR